MLINGNETEKKCFERYSNKLSKLKTLSKKMYFQNELSKCKKKHEKRGKLLNPLWRTHPVVISQTQLR